jgi:hypothetical protein
MAERSEGPARSHRLIGPVSYGGVAVVTALAFGRVFSGSATTFKLLFAGVLSAALAGSLERRSLWLASLVSAVALIIYTGWTVFPATLHLGLPMTATLRAATHALRMVGTDANVQTAPAASLPPLVMAAVVAVWAATFSAHALGVRSGSPLLSLVPPVALVAFADTVLNARFGVIYGVLFLAAGLAVIYADGLRRVERWGPTWAWPTARRWTSYTTARGVRRVGATALATALVAPLVLPGFGTKAVIDLSSHGSEHVQIDPLVSIGAALGDQRSVPILSLSAPVDSYLRLTALDTYDGSTWLPGVNPGPNPVGAFTRLGSVPAQADPGPKVPETVTFTNDFSLPWLPAPAPAEYITVASPQSLDVHYDSNTQTLVAPQNIQSGTTYTVTTQTMNPTPDQLRSVAFPKVPDPQDVALPPNLDPRILQTAKDWTRGQTSVYGKVIAIWHHFQDPSVFSYDTSVPRRDDQSAIVDFLRYSHRGFCQQFAGSMAVLLRELRIPARVAVGFDGQGAPGPKPNTYELTTQQLHAWVEVDFPGIGWVPFDPTPGHRDPAAHSYATSSIASCEIKGNCGGGSTIPTRRLHGHLHGKQQLGQGGLLNEHGGAAGAPGFTSAARSSGWLRTEVFLLFVLALALATAIVVPLWRTSRRRLELRKARREPRRLVLASFSVFAARAADLGLGRFPSETPVEYGARLADAGPVNEPDLRSLTVLASLASYGQADISPADAHGATRSSSTMIRELRRSTPILRRFVGIYRRPDRSDAWVRSGSPPVR